jgi:hypothetical protein
VSFWYSNRHETRPSFATDAVVPETWECPRCGLPAGQAEHNPPAPPRMEPDKTHLAYVKERRSDAGGAAILAEALNKLRKGGVMAPVDSFASRWGRTAGNRRVPPRRSRLPDGRRRTVLPRHRGCRRRILGRPGGSR